MDHEYKQKNELPDLYSILGLTIDICKDPKCDELIRKAYTKKAKICHPDKHPGRNDVVELFELITNAYDILKDPIQRTDYNHKLSLVKESSSDFFKLKKQTEDYTQSLGEYLPPTDTQKLSFKEKMKQLDSKHGYDPSMADNVISIQDAKNKLNQISRSRIEQDLEFKPDKLFDDDRFDLEKFNATFDKYHQTDNGITAHNGIPMAWNDMNNTSNFCMFDKLDNIYVNDHNRTDTSRQNYGSADFAGKPQKITREDIKDIGNADYVHGHKNLEDDYYKLMKAKLRERKSEADKYDTMKYSDFKKDDTAGYGIFDQLGYKFDDRLSLDIDDDISKRLEKIMAEREKKLLDNVNNQPIKPIAIRPVRGSR